MDDGPWLRGAVAVLAALALGAGFTWLPARVPRDLTLTVYAAVVAVLGVFAIFGREAAALAGTIVLGVFVLGAVIYGAIALIGHWAERD